MRQQQEFTMNYPLKQKVVRDLKIVTENVGNLVVEGIGYVNSKAPASDIFERYSVDIETVKWKDADIQPVLEVVGAMDDVIEAAIRYFANQFENQKV